MTKSAPHRSRDRDGVKRIYNLRILPISPVYFRRLLSLNVNNVAVKSKMAADALDDDHWLYGEESKSVT